MNKLVRKAIVTAMCGMLAVSMLPAIPAQAAKKKLSVNRVYDTASKVKGKTKKKYQVRISIGKKTYKSTANKKGNYSVKIPKQAAGETLTVKAYRKKGKKWKYYTKKNVYILAKTISVQRFYKTSTYIKGYVRPRYKVKITINGKTYTKKASSKKGYFAVKMKKAAGNATGTIKLYNTKGKYIKSYKIKACSDYMKDGKPYTGKVPGLTDPIDLDSFNRKLNSARAFEDHSIYHRFDITKSYSSVLLGNGKGKCGYVSRYLSPSNDEDHVWFTAKNGVTLYYKTFKSKDMRNTPVPGPSNCDGKIEEIQPEQFDLIKDSKKNNYYLPIKIVGYKNGKPVLIYSDCIQLKTWYK